MPKSKKLNIHGIYQFIDKCFHCPIGYEANPQSSTLLFEQTPQLSVANALENEKD